MLEPQPWWEEFPNDGLVDLPFFGCATDLSMGVTDIAAEEPPSAPR